MTKVLMHSKPKINRRQSQEKEISKGDYSFFFSDDIEKWIKGQRQTKEQKTRYYENKKAKQKVCESVKL